MILSWIMSVLAVVVLSIVADLILSGKRMGKFIGGVFASLTILIIVAPLPNILKSGVDFDNILFAPPVQIDQDYLTYADNLKVASLERATESTLSSKGYKGADVSIDGQFGDSVKITGVSVNLYNLVMDEKVVHINKYDAITAIASEFLDVNKGVIVVYE